MAGPALEATEKPFYEIDDEKNLGSPNPPPLYSSPSSKNSEGHRSQNIHCSSITNINCSADNNKNPAYPESTEPLTSRIYSCRSSIIPEYSIVSFLEENIDDLLDQRLCSTTVEEEAKEESIYDAFGVGHSSTSISAGLGMAVARDLLGKQNHVIFAIGDGTMTSGRAYEAMNNSRFLDSNLIIVLNDDRTWDHVFCIKALVHNLFRELLIIYDIVPNNSLERLLFDKPKSILDWKQRLHLIKEIASGLFYLHEIWIQVVIHRDIKESNSLLDAELNGRQGLSRLYDHGSHPQTTHVVWTLGYLIPELTRIGMAITSTDVSTFGGFLLEDMYKRIKIFDPGGILYAFYGVELFTPSSLLLTRVDRVKLFNAKGD
ncbi:hypothetical protein IEQ34_021691 [Dendrobium chrysotoxum]|uniref:Protein kinase domain-containing protein n=1 Tax=Dendrobium chrysotoxum TaxID=161865 RepID=A0AAV7G4V0_DENCH|nr:hypothetical protein IEQ34_021691 [Dendrobium chrysotoxum]